MALGAFGVNKPPCGAASQHIHVDVLHLIYGYGTQPGDGKHTKYIFFA